MRLHLDFIDAEDAMDARRLHVLACDGSSGLHEINCLVRRLHAPRHDTRAVGMTLPCRLPSIRSRRQRGPGIALLMHEIIIVFLAVGTR